MLHGLSFFDLVFATAVSQIGHSLYVNNNSITAFLGTISLFVPVWWAWIGVTFYAARFETDDLVHRVFVLLEMMGAAECSGKSIPCIIY